MTVAKVSFAGADGDRVPGLFAVAAGGPRRGCLLFELGLGTTKEQAAFAFPLAAQLGLSTLSVDLREQGERSTGADALARDLRSAGSVRDLVTDTVVDLRRALDFLDARPECRKGIVYVGHSLGGIEGTLLAGADDRVRAAVLISVPATWRDIVATNDELLPGVRDDPGRLSAALRTLAPLDPDRWVGRIAPRPVLLLTGDADPLVPKATAAALARAAGEPATVASYAGGHEPFTGAAGTANNRRIATFLRSVLR